LKKKKREKAEDALTKQAAKVHEIERKLKELDEKDDDDIYVIPPTPRREELQRKIKEVEAQLQKTPSKVKFSEPMSTTGPDGQPLPDFVLAKMAEIEARERAIREWEQRSSKLEELFGKLQKLDKLDQIVEKISSATLIQGNVGLSASGGQSYDEMKKEIEDLQYIIFDDSASEKGKSRCKYKTRKNYASI